MIECHGGLKGLWPQWPARLPVANPAAAQKLACCRPVQSDFCRRVGWTTEPPGQPVTMSTLRQLQEMQEMRHAKVGQSRSLKLRQAKLPQCTLVD